MYLRIIDNLRCFLAIGYRSTTEQTEQVKYISQLFVIQCSLPNNTLRIKNCKVIKTMFININNTYETLALVKEINHFI